MAEQFVGGLGSGFAWLQKQSGERMTTASDL